MELDKDESTEWMSNVKSPTTFFLSSTLYWMYLTSQINFDLTKRVIDEESERLGEKMISINQHWFDVTDTHEAMNRVALDAIVLWTWFWQASYRKISDEINVIKKWGKDSKSKAFNIPSAEYIPAFDIYPSPSGSSVYSSPFVIIRKIKNKNTLNDYYKKYLWTEKIKIDDLESWEILEVKDWDMVVKYMMFNNMPWVPWAWQKYNAWESFTGQHYDILTDNSFRFWERDSATKKIIWDLIEVYELHTDDEITIFCNGIKYWAYKKSFPRRKKPFFSIKLKDSLNMMYGLWTGHLAYNLQKMSDMFLNLRMDISRLEATAPIAVDSWDSFFDWQSVFKPFPWKIVKLTDPSKWWKKLEYWYNANVPWQEVEQITKMIQDSLWLSWYSMWVQQKVERVARWVQELVESVDRSFANFVKSYGDAMSFLQKYWTVMTIETVELEYLNRILWEWADDIKNIPIEDVVYEYKYGFNLNPMKKAKDAAEVQTLISFLQTAWSMTRPDWTPLVDNEFVVDQMIEKMDLPLWTKLDKEEAFEYMKDQVKRNGELKKLEQDSLPQPQVAPDGNPIEQTWQIVPNFNEKNIVEATWAPSWQAGLQSGSIAGEAQVTNPEWINQLL